jgi:hypothetical protein
VGENIHLQAREHFLCLAVLDRQVVLAPQVDVHLVGDAITHAAQYTCVHRAGIVVVGEAANGLLAQPVVNVLVSGVGHGA